MPKAWTDMTVGVIGAGRSGIAAAKLLRRLGARVLLSEKGKVLERIPRGIEVEVGRHSDRLLSSDLLVRSPGVPNHLPIIQKAVRQHIPLWSELELASRQIAPKHLVAITGTNGKTTTTTLVGKLFKAGAAGKTFVGGNIGTPLSAVAGAIRPSSSVVLEVSSYQLEDIERFHPTISAILNVTPDHLEHHGTIAAYAAAKARIFENQTARDVCVLNADDAWCRRLAKRCRARVFWFSRKRSLKQGVSFVQGEIVLTWGKKKESWRLEWSLPGGHNVENALAAIAIAAAAGIPVSIIQKVFKAFRGVEHRLENVRTLKGVRYINDSKATNVDSTRVALESFTQPLILIMGGQGKGSPYSVLESLIRQHVCRLLLIGEDAQRIGKELGSVVPTESMGTLARAVAHAQKIGRQGDVVLLSPACASFDHYKNYEERGRHFKALVARLR
jgi:UDP-N-acetylmuramoylalanine--D-glutamate ligase